MTPADDCLSSACRPVVGAKCLLLLVMFANVGVLFGVTAAICLGPSAIGIHASVAVALILSLVGWAWCVAGDLGACLVGLGRALSGASPAATRPGVSRPGVTRTPMTILACSAASGGEC